MFKSTLTAARQSLSGIGLVCFTIVASQTPVSDAQQPDSMPTGLHRDYIDDQDQRQLADLKFDIDPNLRDSLRINISAIGPHVEPIAGYRGVHGANRYTAEELGWILSGKRTMTIRTRYGDGETIDGRARTGRRGFLPQRNLLPDGRIDFLGRTLSSHPLRMLVSTNATRSGRRTTEVLVDGQVRFRVTYNVQAGRIKLQSVDSVGSDHYLAKRPFEQIDRTVRFAKRSALVFTAFQPDEQPPASVDVWMKCDLEGRWMLYVNSVRKNPQMMDEWMRFLVERKEYELMEWIALYEPDAFKGDEVGDILLSQQAPNWLRVAVWHVTAPVTFGHMRQVANDLVVNHEPELAHDWLLVHQNEIENWSDGVNNCLKTIQDRKFGLKESGALSPPLKSADVLKYLDAPDQLQSFGNARRADPNVVYGHQVIRAINGVTVGGRYEPKWINKVRALTRHQNSRVRQEALLAFSYFNREISPADRFEDFRKMIDDESESAMIREAALIGYSYHPHPSVILKLHAVAADVDHPAWQAAISRLGDIGESFSKPLLDQIDRTRLTTEQQQVLIGALETLQKRFHNIKQPVNAATVIQRIHLAAFAKTVANRHSELITRWAIESGALMVPKSRVAFSKWKEPSNTKYWLPVAKGAYSAEFMAIYETILQ